MRELRHKLVRITFLLITGLCFLNMSFFIGEVALLNLSKDDASIEFVIKILIAGGFEEESETADEHEKPNAKSSDLFLSHSLYHHHHLFLIAQQRFGSLNILVPHSGHLEIFSPPPEA
jgi:hypothetical protein